MRDKNLKYVDEEVRRLMREFGDLIFEQADQGVVDSKWAEYSKMKQLQRDGVRHVPLF
tara:strand:+ start:110 stop:283 length:174 start_codon:yes stop_codon:yes gene_type:complete